MHINGRNYDVEGSWSWTGLGAEWDVSDSGKIIKLDPNDSNALFISDSLYKQYLNINTGISIITLGSFTVDTNVVADLEVAGTTLFYDDVTINTDLLFPEIGSSILMSELSVIVAEGSVSSNFLAWNGSADNLTLANASLGFSNAGDSCVITYDGTLNELAFGDTNLKTTGDLDVSGNLDILGYLDVDSDVDIAGELQVLGHGSFGETSVIEDGIILGVRGTFTNPSSNSLGLGFLLKIDGDVGSFDTFGVSGQVEVGVLTSNTTGDIVGVKASVVITGNDSFTISNIKLLSTLPVNLNFVGGVVDNIYGCYIETGIDAGALVVNEQYGIYIEPQTMGTAGYGIYQAGVLDTNVLVGALEVENTVDIDGDLIVGDTVFLVDSLNGAVAINSLILPNTALRILGLQGAAGTNFGQGVIMIAGGGGQDVGTGIRLGGNAGAFAFSGANGGYAESSDNTATGGDGSLYSMVAGNGGTNLFTGTVTTGGNGGEFIFAGGNGGVANNIGGNGGNLSITGGIGGIGYLTASGVGGLVAITGGAGGADGTVVGGGDGGDLILNGGLGAISTGGGFGNDGNIFLASITGKVRIGDNTTPVELLEVAGTTKTNGFMPDLERFVSNDTLDGNNYTALLDGNLDFVVITLPAAADHLNRIYNIKSIDTTFQTEVATNGSEEIDGDSSNFILSLHESITIQSDGSNWWIL
jgi:hypothetical protein